jgi:hypothetical protein
MRAAVRGRHRVQCPSSLLRRRLLLLPAGAARSHMPAACHVLRAGQAAQPRVSSLSLPLSLHLPLLVHPSWTAPSDASGLARLTRCETRRRRRLPAT